MCSAADKTTTSSRMEEWKQEIECFLIACKRKCDCYVLCAIERHINCPVYGYVVIKKFHLIECGAIEIDEMHRTKEMIY